LYNARSYLAATNADWDECSCYIGSGKSL
jgi:hypothetical protein